MASVAAQVPGGLAAYRLPDQASAITGSLVTLGVLVHQTFFKKQQAEMERIHKIAAEEIAMGRVKIKIAEEATDEDTARRVYIAKTNGITVREQKDIEQEAKRHREDAHVQSDGSAMERPDIQLPDDAVLYLPSTGKACREVLSKIVAAQSALEGQEGHKCKHTGEDGSVATEADNTTDDLKPPAKKQKLQQTGSESEFTEDDPQQLLNQYLEGFNALETPADNFCWLHAIHLSTSQSVSKLIKTLTDMIDHHLPDNEQTQATEHSAFLSRWINAQGEENVQLVRQQLHNDVWPDFDILLPLLSYLFKKTFVVVNLHASGLTQDQVFTYATSNHDQVHVASAASAINTQEGTVYLGLLSRDNHFIGIRPDTQDDEDSHSCPVCLNKFTKSRGIKSTSCYHYVCGGCFDRLNKSQGWRCPMCRERQKYIKPTSDSETFIESKEEETGINFANNSLSADYPDIQGLTLSPILYRTKVACFKRHKQTQLPAPRLLQCDYKGCKYLNYQLVNLQKHQQTHLPADQRPKEPKRPKEPRPKKPKVHKSCHLEHRGALKKHKKRSHSPANYRDYHLGNLKTYKQTHRPAGQRPKRPKSKANNPSEKKAEKE